MDAIEATVGFIEITGDAMDFLCRLVDKDERIMKEQDD